MPTATSWLRLRLIGLVVCILVAGFALTNVLSYRDAVDALKATILHHELPLTGSNIYSEVEADLVRPVFISSQRTAPRSPATCRPSGTNTASPPASWCPTGRTNTTTSPVCRAR